MAWRDVLIASMRLVDIYDARREPGGGSAQASLPARAKKVEEDSAAGMLFELATAIMEYVNELEKESHGRYIPTSDIYVALKYSFPQFTEDDFRFVINKLSIRYSVFFASDGANLRDTALLEKAGAGDRVRLSQYGRIALSLSSASEDWRYSDLDAEKISRAITEGQFASVEKYCIGLQQTIRDAAIEVRKVLENPDLSVKEQSVLYADNDSYSNTVIKIQKVIKNGLELLVTSSTQEKIFKWCEAHPDDIYIESAIRDRMMHTLSMIEGLSRNLSEIINTIHSGGMKGFRTILFTDAARKFALDDMVDWGERFLVNAGFWSPPQEMSGARDILVKSIEKAPAKKKAMRFDQTGAVEVNAVRSFLLKYAPDVVELLRRQPVSLCEVIKTGAIGAKDLSNIGDIIGVFVDASCLGIETGYFQIRFDGDFNDIEEMDSYIRMNDIMIEYFPGGEQ
jgi:hypothetical protein